jgi:ribosomal protein S18 acetylase RimI-like enzyme
MTHLVFKRVTTSNEAEMLRVIRNQCKDYMTRNTSEITPEEQLEWFKTAYKKYELYIAYAVEYGACIVDAGYGLIHLNEKEYMLTGGLVPEYRDKGLGTILFKFLIDNCNKQIPIRLEVLKDNLRALKTYERLNFTTTGETDKIFIMEYKYDSCI